jgi:hypothetical protein
MQRAAVLVTGSRGPEAVPVQRHADRRCRRDDGHLRAQHQQGLLRRDSGDVASKVAVQSSLVTTEEAGQSGKKFPKRLLEFGLKKRLNRRFRKQVGGLLIRGSQVRILPGASKCGRSASVHPLDRRWATRTHAAMFSSVRLVVWMDKVPAAFLPRTPVDRSSLSCRVHYGA